MQLESTRDAQLSPEILDPRKVEYEYFGCILEARGYKND